MYARLMSAGARVLANLGQEKSTIDDFVKEAKVSRGTFYNYFSSRDELLEALWACYGHDPFQQIQRRCRALDDPAERLAVFTRLALHGAKREPTWGWLVVALSADRSTVNEDLRSYPLPDLRAGEAAGVFHFDNLLCAGDAVVGMVRSGLHALLTEQRREDYPELLCKMVLISLGVSRSKAHHLSHAALPEMGPDDIDSGQTLSIGDAFSWRRATG